eukprot:TRINITY_DN8850_c0_g1_i2.p1 TRINITY_DN8850_c0_g1~~TRINITY_DN8850_c0_g1_i2.p1  ORF type:complete len:363 (-),score=42.61 TRINITY_DN8850_c0_g1_i2:193-1197(-)
MGIRDVLLKSVNSDTNRLVKLQNLIRHPILDLYFVNAARMGDEIVYTLTFPLLLWNFDPAFARQVIYLWFWIFYFIHVVKDILCLPRPPVPPVRRLETHYSKEYGFPSAHSAAAFCLPPFIVLHVLQSRPDLTVPLYAFAIWYAVSVSFSRLYVGVHSFTDLAGGISMGVATLAVWWHVRYDVDYFLLTHPYAILVTTLLGFISVATYPVRNGKAPSFDLTMSVAAVSYGTHLGSVLRELLYHSPNGELLPFAGAQAFVLRFVIGGLVVGVAGEAIKHIVAALIGYKKPAADAPEEAFVRFGKTTFMRWVKYTASGVLCVGVAPLVHVYFGLSA